MSEWAFNSTLPNLVNSPSLFTAYFDSESDSNTETDVAGLDSDSDVEVVEAIPRKKIKLEDVKEIEGTTAELSSAGDKKDSA